VVDGDEIDTYDFRVLGTEKSPRPARSMRQGRARARPEPEQAHHRAVVRQGLGLPAGATAPVETDGKEYVIVLQDGTVDGKAVKGN
jgi:hypothetical protein